MVQRTSHLVVVIIVGVAFRTPRGASFATAIAWYQSPVGRPMARSTPSSKRWWRRPAATRDAAGHVVRWHRGSGSVETLPHHGRGTGGHHPAAGAGRHDVAGARLLGRADPPHQSVSPLGRIPLITAENRVFARKSAFLRQNAQSAAEFRAFAGEPKGNCSGSRPRATCAPARGI